MDVFLTFLLNVSLPKTLSTLLEDSLSMLKNPNSKIAPFGTTIADKRKSAKMNSHFFSSLHLAPSRLDGIRDEELGT